MLAVKPAGLVTCKEIRLVDDGIPILGSAAGTATSWLACLWAPIVMAGILAVGHQASRFADLLVMLL